MKTISERWAACGLLLLVTGFLYRPLVLAGQQPEVFAGNYMIGSQDVLNIAVSEQPDISGKYTVEADGTFSFWQLGRVRAKGLTLREFEADLTKRLKEKYFRDPHVSVSVDQYRSQRVFVIGEVRTPGSYPLTGDMSLIEVIARAGSTLPTASGEILIVRAKSPQQKAGDASQNIQRVSVKDLQFTSVPLMDGDTISVPRADSVYVFGEVKNPGAYAVQQETTVLQALSLAGGVTANAAMNRIEIVRMEKVDKKQFKVKLSDLVKPGDTVTVPERYF